MEKIRKIEAVQKMQNYIKEHIADNITLSDLAKACNYSKFHAARIFKELTGKSAFDYIRSYRLSKAALKLRDEKAKVIDVALDFVFDSHEGFTRAFSKEFGITPHKYSKGPPPIKLFTPYSVKDRHLFFNNKGENTMKNSLNNTVFVQVIERPKRKMIIKRGKKAEDYFQFCEEVGCDTWGDIWGMLTSVKEALYEPVGVWLPENFRPEGTSLYAQGVEVPEDYKGEVPSGFELIDLPECKMMVFQTEPYDDEKFMEVIGNLSELMDKYNPEIYGFKWADKDGPRFQLEPQGYRGYIEARPVRLIKK